MYKLIDLSPTPVSSLILARDIAKKTGLHFVYVGNIPQHLGEDTICPVCSKLLIKRMGFTVLENNIIGGKCRFCNSKISGIWN